MKLPSSSDRLPRAFYDRETELVAQELLGKLLLRRWNRTWIGGCIVETEAYLAENDLASHSARGMTNSNASMFGPPGTLYVYPIHAKYCLNAVTEAEQRGAAVLIRAIEPLWGIEAMRTARRQEDLRRLTRGPAMLCQALNVDRQQDGIDLTADKALFLAKPTESVSHEIIDSVRIGISRSQHRRLRFLIKDSPFVSRPAQ